MKGEKRTWDEWLCGMGTGLWDGLVGDVVVLKESLTPSVCVEIQTVRAGVAKPDPAQIPEPRVLGWKRTLSGRAGFGAEVKVHAEMVRVGEEKVVLEW